MHAEGDQGSVGLTDIMNQIEKKLDSAHRKFVPQFGDKSKQDAEVAEFKTVDITEGKGKTPSTIKVAKRTRT